MTKFPLFLLSVLFLLNAQCQRFHLNYLAGAANYQGELLFGQAASKRFTLSQARFAGGIHLEYELSNHVSLRAGFMAGRIGADDKISLVNPARNLNFTSGITEGMAGVQYYLTDPARHFVNLYAFAGLAIFHYNPYTRDSTGRKVFLKPLSTEGQGFTEARKPYTLFRPQFLSAVVLNYL